MSRDVYQTTNMILIIYLEEKTIFGFKRIVHEIVVIQLNKECRAHLF